MSPAPSKTTKEGKRFGLFPCTSSAEGTRRFGLFPCNSEAAASRPLAKEEGEENSRLSAYKSKVKAKAKAEEEEEGKRWKKRRFGVPWSKRGSSCFDALDPCPPNLTAAAEEEENRVSLFHLVPHNNKSKSKSDDQAKRSSYCLRLLPFEMILEILTRLPVPTIWNLRLLSKSCYALITGDPVFHRSVDLLRPRASRQRLLLSTSPFSFSSLEMTDGGIPTPILPPSPNKPIEDVDLIFFYSRECLGMTCFFSGTTIYLWNPTTRETVSSQHPCRLFLHVIGFGYLPSTAEYKVLCAMTEGRYAGDVTYGIFTFRRGCAGSCSSIKMVEAPPPVNFSHFRGATVNGVAYMLPYPKGIHYYWFDPDGSIVRFDLEREEWSLLANPPLPPPRRRYHRFWMASFRECSGSLCVTIYNFHGDMFMWVLKDSCFWVEYPIDLSLFSLPPDMWKNNNEAPPITPLAIEEDGRILLYTFNCSVVYYDPRCKMVEEICRYNPGMSPESLYIESLTSLR